MDRRLYEFILNKEHHRYRHCVDWDLALEYSSGNLSPIERMADRFARLCEEEQAVILPGEQIVFLRTVSNLPPIFTDREWEEIRSRHLQQVPCNRMLQENLTSRRQKPCRLPRTFMRVLILAESLELWVL